MKTSFIVEVKRERGKNYVDAGENIETEGVYTCNLTRLLEKKIPMDSEEYGD